MGKPENPGDFEEYSSGELKFYIHKEIWNTYDMAKGELLMRIEGYGRFTLRLAEDSTGLHKGKPADREKR
ncbi:MAG: hypothetical protein RDV48_15605 [Candidatus Eremiobacteraeota bacterium]|nr:hypothetical protein [Candidatus Eremiobacteraeota bacterium]